MDEIGTYEERRFPAFRNRTVDTLELGRKKHHIPLLLEVDVTEACETLRKFKARTGEGLSFTGWVIKCIGQAVSEHKHVQAMRNGRKRLIVFDDVDISMLVEKSVGHGDGSLHTLPMPYVVRKANQKTVKEINDEIRPGQAETVGEGQVQVGARQNEYLTPIT